MLKRKERRNYTKYSHKSAWILAAVAAASAVSGCGDDEGSGSSGTSDAGGQGGGGEGGIGGQGGAAAVCTPNAPQVVANVAAPQSPHEHSFNLHGDRLTVVLGTDPPWTVDTFNVDGTKLGTTTVSPSQANARVDSVATGAHGVLLAWTEFPASGFPTVHTAAVGADGSLIAGPTPAHTSTAGPTGPSHYSAYAVTYGDGYAVAWESDNTGGPSVVRGRVLDGFGGYLTPEQIWVNLNIERFAIASSGPQLLVGVVVAQSNPQSDPLGFHLVTATGGAPSQAPLKVGPNGFGDRRLSLGGGPSGGFLAIGISEGATAMDALPISGDLTVGPTHTIANGEAGTEFSSGEVEVTADASAVLWRDSSRVGWLIPGAFSPEIVQLEGGGYVELASTADGVGVRTVQYNVNGDVVIHHLCPPAD